MTAKHRSLATFVAGGLFCGIDIERVREIVSASTLTPIPLAPAAVAGLLNLRGHVVPAFDLRVRLGGGDAPDRRGETYFVVLGAGEPDSSLLVDEIGDIVDLEPTAFEAVPETLPDAVRAILEAVVRVEKGLLLCLDADRAIAAASSRNGDEA